MRAVVCKQAELSVLERPDPTPGKGQHADTVADIAEEFGLSPHAPGAYAERMLVEQSLAMPVPNGLNPATRVVVVGVCMEGDRLRPAMAINKEVDLRFVIGHTPIEYRCARRRGAPRGDPDRPEEQRRRGSQVVAEQVPAVCDVLDTIEVRDGLITRWIDTPG